MKLYTVVARLDLSAVGPSFSRQLTILCLVHHSIHTWQGPPSFRMPRAVSAGLHPSLVLHAIFTSRITAFRVQNLAFVLLQVGVDEIVYMSGCMLNAVQKDMVRLSKALPKPKKPPHMPSL